MKTMEYNITTADGETHKGGITIKKGHSFTSFKIINNIKEIVGQEFIDVFDVDNECEIKKCYGKGVTTNNFMVMVKEDDAVPKILPVGTLLVQDTICSLNPYNYYLKASNRDYIFQVVKRVKDWIYYRKVETDFMSSRLVGDVFKRKVYKPYASMKLCGISSWIKTGKCVDSCVYDYREYDYHRKMSFHRLMCEEITRQLKEDKPLGYRAYDDYDYSLEQWEDELVRKFCKVIDEHRNNKNLTTTYYSFERNKNKPGNPIVKDDYMFPA